MKKNPTFQVNTESELLPFLLDCLSNKSRNYVKGLLKRGQITVNGKACTDYACALSPGQQIEILLQVAPARDKLALPVIYEDNDLIVIDKPAGMLSVSTDKESGDTAYHLVSRYVKARNKSGQVFIVHRLDRDTSGVLLLAKSESIKRSLQENWNDNVLQRRYMAVVEGVVATPEQRIVSWLKQTKTLLVYSSHNKGDGKMAITNLKALQITAQYSLLELALETGRKNQIRVHMKDIGHPIAGDKKYGARTDPFGRLGLHASVLIIRHPSTGAQMRFESPPPGAFFKGFNQ